MKAWLLFLYGGNMRTRLRALAAGYTPVMNELLHMLDPSFKRGPQSLKATVPPNIMQSVLTTRQWPTSQKWIGTSRMVSRTQHSSGSILGRKILHWSPYTWHWCRDIIFIWIKQETTSPCTGSRVNTSHGRIDLCFPVSNTGPRGLKQLRRPLLCGVS